jgi:hypothetical protein
LPRIVAGISLQDLAVLRIIRVKKRHSRFDADRAGVWHSHDTLGGTATRRFFLAGIAAAVMAFSASQAQANYCGAASYQCCPPAACQPTCCYTACRVQRKTCYRTVYETCYQPEQYTVNKTVYETVYEDRQQTCYRNVTETQCREEPYTVRKPVMETSCREETYQVQKPIWETSYKECCYTTAKPVWENCERECRRTVLKPVWENCERECRRTVMRPVTETINQERCYIVMRPVTTYRTVSEDQGCWTTQKVCIPGPVVPRLVCDPCCGPRICMVRCPGVTTGMLKRPALALHWQPDRPRRPTPRPQTGMFRYSGPGLPIPARPPRPELDTDRRVQPAARPER